MMQIKINTINPSHCHTTTHPHLCSNLPDVDQKIVTGLHVRLFVLFVFCIFIPKIFLFFLFLKSRFLQLLRKKYIPLINASLCCSSGMQTQHPLHWAVLESQSQLLGCSRGGKGGTRTPLSILQEGLRHGACLGRPSPVLPLFENQTSTVRFPLFISEAVFYSHPFKNPLYDSTLPDWRRGCRATRGRRKRLMWRVCVPLGPQVPLRCGPGAGRAAWRLPGRRRW